MKPSTKEIHWWNGEVGTTLAPGLMPPAKHDLFACVWNDFNNSYEYFQCSRGRWYRLWNTDAVPTAFRVYLLVLGVA